MRLMTLSLALVAALVGAVLAQPQLQPGVFSALRVSGVTSIGTLTDIGPQELDVLSAASDTSGGLAVRRTLNGSYVILNTNTAGASGVGYLQAGDTNAYRPFDIQPLGGGVRIGTTSAANVITGIFAASVTYDAPSVADNATTVAAPTVTGATTGSVCSASLTTLAGIDMTISAQASATNTVRVTLFNKTGGAVDLASGTLRVVCINVP